jgi:hypothetical protein
MGVYVVVFRLEPFVFSEPSGPYSWMPFLSFMQGSIDIDVQSFFEKFFLYGGLIWLLAEMGMATRLATLLVAALVLGASFVEVFIPGRSAEITDTILALAIGEFIRALEVGAVDRARYRSLVKRGVPQPDTLSHRLIAVEKIETFIEVAE